MRVFSSKEKQFILDHQRQDPASLMLQTNRYPDLPMVELVQQIQARQKAAAKLPTFVQNPDVIFPVSLSVEQSSSETTAAYKASLIEGEMLIDLTGGFGIDTFHFARHFAQVVHVEQNEALSEIATYNFKLLQASNIKTVNTSAEEFLELFTGKADVIYLDPARRGNHDEKLHLLKDCQPDVLGLLPILLSKANAVLLKTSPMLDIDLALEQLGSVVKLWVLAVQNEVKEVLYLLRSNAPTPDQVEQVAVNLLPGKEQVLEFTRAAEELAKPFFTDPQQFIYEPNAAILKAGAYKYLGQHLGINKLHPNSHLYTLEQELQDFPGRAFRCMSTSRYNKKELLRLLPQKKANITVRNFPDSVADIRKKTGIKEGGDYYLFFTTDMHQKPVVLHCQKI
ncbi:RsmD family RNA methyltransferase [Pontibacter silvestris]|uniref:RsmD family RNA methyltransferase n=1 Tax=Pontibacter silvestris TaxID=2305183 RepID=A0ABW4WY38_9BACT|nr:RsmD family RNA methyltransferase [Pontibacter silvestris]MCC9137614.1 class I SAM-dependent methyltransferase [Pontibacter silvestris]